MKKAGWDSPIHVAKGETLVAAAAPFVFNVVDKPTKLDTESCPRAAATNK